MRRLSVRLRSLSNRASPSGRVHAGFLSASKMWILTFWTSANL